MNTTAMSMLHVRRVLPVGALYVDASNCARTTWRPTNPRTPPTLSARLHDPGLAYEKILPGSVKKKSSSRLP
jgi:hypothetical protein